MIETIDNRVIVSPTELDISHYQSLVSYYKTQQYMDAIGIARENGGYFILVRVLAIKDEGAGISQHVIDKIGIPFITIKDNGTGLGLAICYSIAQRHNARIEFVTSTHGTIFYVSFAIA
ncbi:ATP-binding protein [Pelosinus baikalensis]|uniref:ATP-binding protein n=1 Tax=Pelosinus baikalensis TaxID=2892015 RepID=UPI001E58723C|nr:ATP-binding protein [Pelosinus baikalensis]